MEQHIPNNGEPILLGTPCVHLRCTACGHIGLENYGNISLEGCKLCGGKVPPTIYVSMPVGNVFSRSLVKGVLSSLFDKRDDKEFVLALPPAGPTESQSEVIKAAEAFVKHTSQPAANNLKELAEQATALLANLTRAVNGMNKRGEGV
jgi:hypothetical protein